jgi:hypothetical protein
VPHEPRLPPIDAFLQACRGEILTRKPPGEHFRALREAWDIRNITLNRGIKVTL